MDARARACVPLVFPWESRLVGAGGGLGAEAYERSAAYEVVDGRVGAHASCVKYSLQPQSRLNTTAGGMLFRGGDATRQYCSSLEVRTCYFEPARHLRSRE